MTNGSINPRFSYRRDLVPFVFLIPKYIQIRARELIKTLQTRITTKYTIKRPPSPASIGKPRKRQRQFTSVEPSNTIASPSAPTAPRGPAVNKQPKEETTTSAKTSSKPSQKSSSDIPTPSQQPRANLTLKTYDPVSGVCLKYETDKAAEVGRLVAGLGQLGKGMCGLPSTPPLDTSNTTATTEVGPLSPSNNANTSNSKADVDGVLPSGKGGLVDAQADNSVRESKPPTGSKTAGAAAAEGKSGTGTGTGGGTGGKKKKKGKR